MDSSIRGIVYLSGPMTGISLDEMTAWRRVAKDRLTDVGISTLDPTRECNMLVQHEEKALAYARDLNDVKRSTALLVYLLGATKVSIGTVYELAWAGIYQKPVVLVMEPSCNIHEHLFLDCVISARTDDLGHGIDLIQSIIS